MKKAAVFVLAGAILAGMGAVVAADQSLVSKSYLTGTFTQQALDQAEDRIDTLTQPAYDSALSSLNQKHQTYLAQAGSQESGGSVGLLEDRYKKGDTVLLTSGSGAMLLAGDVQIAFTGNAVIDTTAGQTLTAGTLLPANHRVLAGENTSLRLTVNSDTAVLALEGEYTVTGGSGVDYNAMADALAEMGLLQGTGVSYGSGYELERTSMRIEGLVMFIRLLGEERAALQSVAPNPFADVPSWADRYVAYAYEKGYTTGTGTAADGTMYFSPNATISAGEYMTFLLRALGYSDHGEDPDFTWQTAMADGVTYGVLREKERTAMEDGNFLRSRMVYLSCCGLAAHRKDGVSQLTYTANNSGDDWSQMEISLAKATVLRIK